MQCARAGRVCFVSFAFLVGMIFFFSFFLKRLAEPLSQRKKERKKKRGDIASSSSSLSLFLFLFLFSFASHVDLSLALSLFGRMQSRARRGGAAGDGGDDGDRVR